MRKEIILFVGIIVAFVFWQFYVSRFHYGETSLLNKPAPAFFVQAVEADEDFALASVLGKKVVLVNFWATWCDTCRLEISPLGRIFKALQSESFAFVSILEDDVAAIEEAEKLLKKYHEKLPVEFPVYLDDHQTVADLFGTYKIPETFLIDLHGNVVHKHEGAITQNEVNGFLEKIQNLLQ